MNTVCYLDGSVQIPDGINDLAAFRHWVYSSNFPERGRICYLEGEVWVDMSPEQVFTHNQVKFEFNLIVGSLVKSESLGRYFPDGLLLTNSAANLSTEPDGTFISRSSLVSKRVKRVRGTREGVMELQGIPDMVLEVVSSSSIRKATKILPELYWRAGIQEYWLVDARGERLVFDILRHSSDGYKATRKQAGWLKSTVFGRSFRLTRRTDDLGDPAFKLDLR